VFDILFIMWSHQRGSHLFVKCCDSHSFHSF